MLSFLCVDGTLVCYKKRTLGVLYVCINCYDLLIRMVLTCDNTNTYFQTMRKNTRYDMSYRMHAIAPRTHKCAVISTHISMHKHNCVVRTVDCIVFDFYTYTHTHIRTHKHTYSVRRTYVFIHT